MVLLRPSRCGSIFGIAEEELKNLLVRMAILVFPQEHQNTMNIFCISRNIGGCPGPMPDIGSQNRKLIRFPLKSAWLLRLPWLMSSNSYLSAVQMLSNDYIS